MNIIEIVRPSNVGKVFECNFNENFRYRVVEYCNKEVELETMTLNKNEWHKVSCVNSKLLSWEFTEIYKKVTFNEVLNSNKRCTVKHFFIDEELEIQDFDNIMEYLSVAFTTEMLKEIIKNGEWYLE